MFKQELCQFAFFLGEILTIEILVALNGVNLLLRFFKKREVNRFVSGL